MPAMLDIPHHELGSMRPVAGEVRDVSRFQWRDAGLGGSAALPALRRVRLAEARLSGAQLSGVVLTGTAGNDTLIGGSGDDTLYGLDGHDNLQGGAGDDTLDAGDGDDILIGGPGNDTLYGNLGNDAYFFGLGDGHDVIHSVDHEGQFFVTLNLKLGIHPDEVALERSGLDLIVRLVSGETITLAGYFPPLDDPWQWPRAVDEFWFQEGHIWETADILARLESGGQMQAGPASRAAWAGGSRAPAPAPSHRAPASAQLRSRGLAL